MPPRVATTGYVKDLSRPDAVPGSMNRAGHAGTFTGLIEYISCRWFVPAAILMRGETHD
jgi:hypothetical protein